MTYQQGEDEMAALRSQVEALTREREAIRATTEAQLQAYEEKIGAQREQIEQLTRERDKLSTQLDYIVACQDDKTQNPGDEMLALRAERDALQGALPSVADLATAKAIVAEGRASHVAWAAHLRHCPGCDECKRLGIDWNWEREQSWVDKYDHLSRVLVALSRAGEGRTGR